jgi:hypothetical protein
MIIRIILSNIFMFDDQFMNIINYINNIIDCIHVLCKFYSIIKYINYIIHYIHLLQYIHEYKQ